MKVIIKIRKHTILLIILIVSELFSVYGQNTTIDSLKNLLIQNQERDTNRVVLLNNIAYKLYYIKPEQSLKYAQEALSLAESLNFISGKAESLRIIGVYYKVKGYYTQAMKYYFQALKISEKTSNKKSISKVLNNIGILYKAQDDYKNAFKYTQKSLKVNREINYKRGIASNLTNLGILNAKLEKSDKALKYHHEALALYKQIDYKLGIANSYINIGEVYLNTGYYTKALNYFKKALNYNKKIDYKLGVCISYKDLGICYFETKYYSRALNNAVKGMKEAKQYNFLTVQKDIYKLLSNIYKETNNYKKAYQNYVLYKKLNDSIFSAKNLSRIATMEYQYNYDKEKQADMLLQQKKEAVQREEAKRQRMIRNLFVLGFIVAAVFGLVILYGFLQKQKANKILTRQKKEIETKNSELHLQNEQINAMNTTLDEQKEQLKQSNIELIKKQDAILNQSEELKTLSYKLKKLNQNLEEKVKNRTAELEVALKKAEESRNLITAFLENMSHEIRTPMNAISGFAQLLSEHKSADKTISQYANIISKNTDDLIEFIENIMDASKLQADQYVFLETLFDLNLVFHSAFDKLVNHKKLKAEKVNCVLNLPFNDGLFILSDFKAFMYIVYNLFENALKYTEKGKVEIGYKLTKTNGNTQIENRKFKIGNNDSDFELVIFIKDTGIGIDQKEYNIIFDFFRKLEKSTERLYRGTGLGLAIVNKVVNKLGASIDIKSKTNLGTQIFVKIPLIILP